MSYLYHISVYGVDEGKPVDVLYLDFVKPLTLFPTATLMEKLAAYGLDRCTLCWVKNWLDGLAQRLVVNGVECYINYINLEQERFKSDIMKNFSMKRIVMHWNFWKWWTSHLEMFIKCVDVTFVDTV